MVISTKAHKLNREIVASEVRIISLGSLGTPIGVVTLNEALQLARAQNLDLIEVVPTASPPVCKIQAYDQFIYELKKREKEVKKKQRVTQLKELRLSTRIEPHDIAVKVKNAEKIIGEGDKVKVIVSFKGREISHPQIGRDILTNVIERAAAFASPEKEISFEGRNMVVTLVAKK